MQQLRAKNKKRAGSSRFGFTLIEMLVSVGLFSVVLTVALGSILTIADANKKARSLMSVMGNLNFAVDALTRSIKTGSDITDLNDCIVTSQVDYNASDPGNAPRQRVTYCWSVDANDKGSITKQVDLGATLPLTSPDVDIDYMNFGVYGNVEGDQPRVAINMEGTVTISPRVSSSFTIQTTVSQRQLNLDYTP